jgi:hypothetical protein
MFVDHGWRYLHVALPGAQVVGRFAFPLFAVALCVQATNVRVESSVRRLMVLALVASPSYAVVTGGVGVNVLVTLALGLQAWSLLSWSCVRRRALGLLLCAVGASVAEYGCPGFLFVLAGCGVVVPRVLSRVEWLACWVCAGAVLAVGGGVGFVGGAVLGVVLAVYGPAVRRVRFFAPAYVLQWPAMAVLRVFGV